MDKQQEGTWKYLSGEISFASFIKNYYDKE